MIYLFLADGFEIVEAMAPVDMLRRAKLEVKTVGVTGKSIASSCGVKVECDLSIDEVKPDGEIDAVVLPGGMPGTKNLEASSAVQSVIDYAAENGKLVAAICAAPSILGHKGLLKGREAIAFPGFESDLEGAKISKDHVVRDGNFITAKGAGVAVDFGLEIVAYLSKRETADAIRASIQCR